MWQNYWEKNSFFSKQNNALWNMPTYLRECYLFLRTRHPNSGSFTSPCGSSGLLVCLGTLAICCPCSLLWTFLIAYSSWTDRSLPHPRLHGHKWSGHKASASLWRTGTFRSSCLVISWFAFTLVFNLILKGWNFPFKRKKLNHWVATCNIRRNSQPKLLSWERKLFFLE